MARAGRAGSLLYLRADDEREDTVWSGGLCPYRRLYGRSYQEARTDPSRQGRGSYEARACEQCQHRTRVLCLSRQQRAECPHHALCRHRARIRLHRTDRRLPSSVLGDLRCCRYADHHRGVCQDAVALYRRWPSPFGCCRPRGCRETEAESQPPRYRGVQLLHGCVLPGLTTHHPRLQPCGEGSQWHEFRRVPRCPAGELHHRGQGYGDLQAPATP